MAPCALIVTFQYGQTDLTPLFELEDRLREAIESARCGEYDGHEIAADGSDGTLYIYGHDREALLEVVSPILASVAFMDGASIELREEAPDGDVSGSEVIEQAIELRQQGMMTEAAELLASLAHAEDLDTRVQALLEIAATQSLLHDHAAVLASLERVESSLKDHFGYNVLESSEEEDEEGEGLHQVRLLRHKYAAEACEALGRMDEAIDHARAAAAAVRRQRNPGDEDQVAHREYVVGVLLRRAGRLDEALAALDAALTESSGHIPSLIAKATYLELAGRKEEGEALFLTIQPQDEAGRAYFALNAAGYHGLRGEKRQMLQSLEEATGYWGGQSVVAFALDDTDFAPYRADPEFVACLDRLRPLKREPSK